MIQMLYTQGVCSLHLALILGAETLLNYMLCCWSRCIVETLFCSTTQHRDGSHGHASARENRWLHAGPHMPETQDRAFKHSEQSFRISGAGVACCPTVNASASRWCIACYLITCSCFPAQAT